MASQLAPELRTALEGMFEERVAATRTALQAAAEQAAQATRTALQAELGARFEHVQAAGAGLQAELDVSRAEKAQLEERLAEARATIEDGRRQLVHEDQANARNQKLSPLRAWRVSMRGARQMIFAERETIVSCGALKSPQLLMLSGIGPADHLRAHGIPVLVDAPRVGQGLQNHVCYRPQYLCNAPVTASGQTEPWNVLKAMVRYAISRSGPFAESYGPVGGFFSAGGKPGGGFLCSSCFPLFRWGMPSAGRVVVAS